MKYVLSLLALAAVLAAPATGPAAGQSATIGSPAPSFTLDGVVAKEFRKISLSDYRGKWVVLFFYPGDFTFVCPTEIKGFNKSLEIGRAHV